MAKFDIKQASKQFHITAKVSAKGQISVYGLQRFPVTLSAEQWLALMASGQALVKFILAHEGELTKHEERAATTKEGHTALVA